MKTLSEARRKDKVKAGAKRPVGAEAEKLPQKQKRLLNLKEENQHTTGREKFAGDEATREVKNNSNK